MIKSITYKDTEIIGFDKETHAPVYKEVEKTRTFLYCNEYELNIQIDKFLKNLKYKQVGCSELAVLI